MADKVDWDADGAGRVANRRRRGEDGLVIFFIVRVVAGNRVGLMADDVARRSVERVAELSPGVREARVSERRAHHRWEEKLHPGPRGAVSAAKEEMNARETGVLVAQHGARPSECFVECAEVALKGSC